MVKNGALLATPFVSIAVDSAGERGLLGVALSPNFATNGFVYVYATRTRAACTTASAASPPMATSPPPAARRAGRPADAFRRTNHNGGGMHFGIDGKLYVGVGENANAAQAQNLDVPFGKLLRFNDDGSIPSDNPFSRAGGLARAIWAHGLRNPFTFAVAAGYRPHPHQRCRRRRTWEEINVGSAGANYGWPSSEGPDNVGAGVSAPLFAYKHSDAARRIGPGGFFTGFAIAGGAFYPASGAFPTAYRDQYYFADFVSRFVARLDLANGNAAYAFASLSGLRSICSSAATARSTC